MNPVASSSTTNGPDPARVQSPIVRATLLNRITLALSAFGLFVAGTLSLSHLFNRIPPCGAQHGCEIVATHPSSMLFGVFPVAYLGFGAYLTFAALAFLRAKRGIGSVPRLTMLGYAFSAIGMIWSLALTYYSINMIHATCLWCLTSAGIMVAMFFTHVFLASDLDTAPKEADPKAPLLSGALGGLAILGLGIQSAIVLKGEKLPDTTKYEQFGVEKFIPKDSLPYGNPNAPVTIVEFGDLMCPSCRLDFPGIKQLVEQGNNNVKWVFRHFPLHKVPGHEESVHAATLAEIAGETGKRWQFIEAVYQQPEESIHSIGDFNQSLLIVGMDVKKSVARLDDKDDPAFNTVYRDIKDGESCGVYSTPTFFVVAPGEKPKAARFNDLPTILDSEPYRSLIRPKKNG